MKRLASSPTTSTVNIIRMTSEARTKDIIDPEYPLLEAQRSKIKSIEQDTFEYATKPSRLLDVYYPLSIASTTPILIFIYGGGFTKGSRSSPPSHLVYSNLGYFFASRGIITVIPDYRLLPDARYPDGSEDVAAAFGWVLSSDSSSSFKARCGDCKERALWAIGHSAGGIHLVTMMLLPSLFNLEISRALKGVVIMGTPFEVSNGKFPFRTSAQTYYGSPSLVGSRQPISLLRDVKKEHLQTFPKEIWNMVAGSEPKRIKSAHTNFARIYRERGGMVNEWVMEGHDHMSPVLALGSGVGEEWGEEVIKIEISASSVSRTPAWCSDKMHVSIMCRRLDSGQPTL